MLSGPVLVSLAVGIVRGLGSGAPSGDLGSIWNGLLAAAGIALISVLIGGPAGFAARGWRGWKLGLLLAPVLLPSFLVYASWNLMRAPGTWTGDWLLSMAVEGANWAPRLVGHVIAVVGLGIWASPIAAVIVAAGARAIGADVFESLRSEAGRGHRALEVLRLLRGSVVFAFAVVAAVMLGSAVPLHVAQLPTPAIDVWLELSLLAPGEQAPAWLAAWPSVVIAVVIAWVLASRLTRSVGAEERRGEGDRSRGGWAWALAPLALGAAAPGVMLAWDLGSAAPIGAFWARSGGAVADTAGVSLLACVLLAPVGPLVASAIGMGRMPGVVCVGVLLTVSLLPGVLVGSALLETRVWLEEAVGSRLELGPVVPALGLAARFGGLAAVLGVVLARAESREMRDLGAMESGGPLGFWLGARLPAQAPVLAAWMVGIFFLGLHEIEASVLLRPPGAGNLAAKLLADLHYQRVDSLSAAGLSLLGIGLVLALSAWGGGRLLDRRGSR